jgi:Tfp pilus assembly protein PilX
MHMLPPRPARRSERGAALLMSMLVLLVLAALAFQISVTAQTDARIGRNDVTLTTMDLSIESALLEVCDKLKVDGEGGGGEEAAGAQDPAANPQGAAQQPADPAAAAQQGGQSAPPTDSRRDEWAMPQRTEINEIRLRILVQDEDSKYNVLNLLNPDEKEAEAAFGRVVRILDLCREGTLADIEERTAQDMARAMLDHMSKRKTSSFPRPKLLTDDESTEDQGLPLSMRDFLALRPFEESHFRDFRDEDGEVVHSIETFLTVWSSLETSAEMLSTKTTAAQNAAAAQKKGSSSSSNKSQNQNQNESANQGQNAQNNAASGGNAPKNKSETNGYGVNVNTAPAAVLKGLFDDRELAPRFWDEVIEYRNLEEEKEEGAVEEEEDPEDAPLDEYGQPILERRIFEQVAEIQELDGWEKLLPAVQDKVTQLLSTQSHVFTIFVIAKRATSQEGDTADVPRSAAEKRAEEEKGDSLMRVVRCVVWRAKKDDQVVLVPVQRWEVLDYYPYEVIDFPDEER